MSSLVHLNDQNFAAEVLNASVPVLVDFHAVWCGPCKQLAPILEQMNKDLAGKVKFTKLDLDEAPSTASTFGIMSVPTMIVFKGGKERGRAVGFKPRGEIEKLLKLAE